MAAPVRVLLMAEHFKWVAVWVYLSNHFETILHPFLQTYGKHKPTSLTYCTRQAKGPIASPKLTRGSSRTTAALWPLAPYARPFIQVGPNLGLNMLGHHLFNCLNWCFHFGATRGLVVQTKSAPSCPVSMPPKQDPSQALTEVSRLICKFDIEMRTLMVSLVFS